MVLEKPQARSSSCLAVDNSEDALKVSSSFIVDNEESYEIPKELFCFKVK